MHILAPNQTAEKYPYSIGQLRKDNPQVSFPRNPSEEILASYGVFPVTQKERPAYDYTMHDLSEGTPELVSGSWVQTWHLNPVSSEVTANRTAELSASVRADRDQRLSETDWIVIKAYERSQSIPSEWEVYRQALRDITAQAGFPHSVEWPVKP